MEMQTDKIKQYEQPNMEIVVWGQPGEVCTLTKVSVENEPGAGGWL